MDSDILIRNFESIGARLLIVPLNINTPGKSPRLMVRGNRTPAEGFSVEVKMDSRGMFFEIRTNGKAKFISTEGKQSGDSKSLFLFAETRSGTHTFSCGRTGNMLSVYRFPKTLAKTKLLK